MSFRQTGSFSGFLSICYHYIRPEKKLDNFPRIIGHEISVFEDHLTMLKQNYDLISLDESLEYLKGNQIFKKKYGALLTFDDGLSDHYEAAKILKENEIKGIFFIPSCIVEDNKPANPIIIHYGLAMFGIERFLDEYKIILESNNIVDKQYVIKFEKGVDNVWDVINRIKEMFIYNFDIFTARKILLQIFDQLILSEYPDAMKIMHLTKEKIKKILDMGHSIGTHSHTHVSVGGSNLSKHDFNKEVILPKKILEKEFGTKIIAMSYPFGEKQDCLSTAKLIENTHDFQLAFTISGILNTLTTPPLELGRYQPTSSDDAKKLDNTLKEIVKINY